MQTSTVAQPNSDSRISAREPFGDVYATTPTTPVARSHGSLGERSTHSVTVRGATWRSWLVIGSALAVAIPIVWMGAAPTMPMAPDLARLLRMMAVLKAVIAVVAMGVVWWRFAFPTLFRFAISYVSASSLMAGGSVVMWQLTHLIAGAAIFHAGLALVLLAAWRDNRTAQMG